MTLHLVSHRGLWHEPAEKNSRLAFERSLESGYGIETDLRDRGGEIVISHDPAGDGCMSLDDFLGIYTDYPQRPTLALNIKSDGLQALLAAALEKHKVDTYFVFDMSVPDLLGYRRRGLTWFTRHSEYEQPPALYAEAKGVWLDQFQTDWIDEAALAAHADAGKAVCIVSPELHGRPYEAAWAAYRRFLETDAGRRAKVMLCTDFPHLAEGYFA